MEAALIIFAAILVVNAVWFILARQRNRRLNKSLKTWVNGDRQ
jgi:hypothetical protein